MYTGELENRPVSLSNLGEREAWMQEKVRE